MDPNATRNEILAPYAQPGLASELLQRQDSQGLDVVLYLFLRCAEAYYHPLDEAAKARAADHVRDWRDEVGAAFEKHAPCTQDLARLRGAQGSGP